MSWVIAVPAALGAAGTSALASALQHHSTRTTPPAKTLRATQLARFARALLSHRVWQLAVGIQAVGLVLHALALRNGALSAVQPLLITGIVFALPLNRLVGREQITRAEIGWALMLVTGLVGFLVVSTAAPTATVAHGSGLTLGLVAGSVAVLVAACVAASRYAGPAFAAALLGTATGAAYATQALLLQATTHIARGGITALATHGAVYGLIVFGTAGFALTQLAFRAGPLAASLPAITAVNTLGGIVLGLLVNGEQVRTGTAALAGESAGLTLLAVAVIALTHTARRPRPTSPETPQ